MGKIRNFFRIMMKSKGKYGRIYISGPVTGNSRYREQFGRAERLLALEGWKVCNPVRNERDGMEWSWYLRRDIRKLLKCSAIYMMRGWTRSRGARLERTVASSLGMAVIYEEDNEWK